MGFAGQTPQNNEYFYKRNHQQPQKQKDQV